MSINEMEETIKAQHKHIEILKDTIEEISERNEFIYNILEQDKSEIRKYPEKYIDDILKFYCDKSNEIESIICDSDNDEFKTLPRFYTLDFF